MLISEELAQRIVDSTMQLVHRNVNIMNREGTIIATGHPHRRHTFHKGAKDVIETGMVVEIQPDQLDQYPGALQGVNLPIVLDEQVIGVVGVFGAPDEVRDTGRLVKTITELILERELLQGETRSKNKLREQFLESAFSSDVVPAMPKLKRLAKAMNFNLSLSRAVSITDIAPFIQETVSGYGSSELVLERAGEAVLKHVEQAQLIDDQDIAVVWDEKLIVLKAFTNHCTTNALTMWTHQLLLALQSMSCKIACSGLGSTGESIFSYSLSYKQAQYCLSQCSEARTVLTIYDHDLLTGYILSESVNSSVSSPLSQLSRRFSQFLLKKPDGKKTLEAFLAQNLNLSRAADALFIHRNTLMFRLDQLQTMTGLDPAHSFDDAVLCRILLEMNKHAEAKQSL